MTTAGVAGPSPTHAEDVLTCLGQVATIVGTDGDDVIAGTDGADVIVARGGRDRINAGAGNDVICSGPDVAEASDDDVIDAGDGDDAVLSGSGDDRIALGLGNDYAESGEGVDEVRGLGGDDYIDSGAGDDLLDGGAGADYIEAGEGKDHITSSGAGSDYLSGGEGADNIQGAADTDYVDGGDGSDTISTPSGFVAGGSGDDTVTGGALVSYVSAGDGSDVVRSSGYLDGGAGADILTATGAGGYGDGGDGDDVLYARGTGITLEGGSGNDELYGSANADVLLGGDGNDTLDAAAGDDTLIGAEGFDVLLGRAGGDDLRGGAGEDTLTGGVDADSFYGGEGRDTLRAVDDVADTTFDCGAQYESDKLIADEAADADVPRNACDNSISRVYTVSPSSPPVGAWYVALGDSFSAGEGTHFYDDDLFGGPYCHRGPLAWPRVLGRKYIGLADDSIDHQACTGALTHHMLIPWPAKSQDPQIRRRVQARTDLVTFTIGGNDLGFADLMVAIRGSYDDVGSPAITPSSPAFNRRATKKRLLDELSDLEVALKPVYRQLRRFYPNAELVHVGYPRILPSLEGDAKPFRCGWLGQKEQELADWVVDHLNATIREAAQASPEGVEYVDVSEALDGHELCAPKNTESWVNDLAFESDDIFGEGSTERGHPNLAGQFAYADAVASGLGL